MKYELPIKLTGYFPEVFSTLASIDDSCVYSEERSLSHPSDLFMLAFLDVIECAYRLAKRVNIEVSQKTENESYLPKDLDDIRIDIFNLIFYAANFVEACQSIVKSMFPEGDKDKNFTKAAREFSENIVSYRSHVSKIINQIKHQHRRVRPFTYSWSNKLIVGYFIEGLVDVSTVGPEPKVHVKFHEMNTGFSINRDIPYHLVNIYFVSSCLNSIIKKIAKINPSAMKLPDCDSVVRCLQEVSSIPALFFPDEIEKESPAIRAKNGDAFSLELPSKITIANKYPHIANISVTTRMGLRNRSFAPPYAVFKNR